MSLANVYRPQSFSEVVGNSATVKSLQVVLGRPVKDIPHALLFSGPSGCGKTTLARLAGKALNCGDMDWTELDSAHFRGVDTIRELRHQSGLNPVSGPVRVWLLDEVHQLTKDGQSALLKLLEDAPPKAFFLLATTEPDKLLPTIRSRCMSFVVQPLEPGELLGLLQEVVEAEGKKVPREILTLISENAMGSPRVALVALDRIIGLPPAEMKAAVVRAVEAEAVSIELLRALMGGKPWSTVAEILRRLPPGEDPESIRRAALGYASVILLKGENQRAFLMLDAFLEPYFNTGKAGLVHSCWLMVKG